MAANNPKTPNGKVNRSQAIRDVLEAHPEYKAKDVVAHLKEQGIKVSGTLVYIVGRKRRRAGRRKQREERVIETSRRTGVAYPVQLLVKVKALAVEIGGIRTLKAFVDALAE